MAEPWGLHHAMEDLFITILQQEIGTWVNFMDNLTQTTQVRGSYSREPPAYPQVKVKAHFGNMSPTAAGGVYSAPLPIAGVPQNPIYAQESPNTEVHCTIRSQQEDEAIQLTDLILSAMFAGINSSGVKYLDVLRYYGCAVMGANADHWRTVWEEDLQAEGEENAAGAPNQLRENIIVFQCRTLFSYTQVQVWATSVKMVLTLKGPRTNTPPVTTGSSRG